MKNFYNSFTFIITFMILLLVFNMMFGGKFVEWFLLLVLLSMVIINADKVKYIFNGIEEAYNGNRL